MKLTCMIVDDAPLAVRLPEHTRVIFTTAFKEYAFESYEVNALDFLLKPIRYNKFLAAIEKARKQLAPQPEPSVQARQQNTVFVRVDGEWRNIAIDKIAYVSCIKDYVMFYLDDEPKPLITHLTMKAVEQMLPTEKFLRIHRSYIVAVDRNTEHYKLSVLQDSEDEQGFLGGEDQAKQGT